MKNSAKILLIIVFSFFAQDCLGKDTSSFQDAKTTEMHEIILNQDITTARKIELFSLMLNDKTFNINAQDANGKTALNLATFYKADPELVKFLIENGAQVNVPDRFNVTPLHNAIKYEEIPVATMLLAMGADKTWKTDEGATAIDLARTKKTKALFEADKK